MIRILCFGDSLTYGQVPGTLEAGVERYDESIRWTAKLQQKLGPKFSVIEEGLPSRTIDINDPRPGKDGRSADTYLLPCVESHLPLDLVTMWLGTNDTKDIFNKTTPQIADSMEKLLIKLTERLNYRNSSARIILVAPPLLDPNNKFLAEVLPKPLFTQSLPKLKGLPQLYKGLAEKYKLEYLNMQEYISMPETKDGTHLSPEQNAKVAEVIYEKIKEVVTQ